MNRILMIVFLFLLVEGLPACHQPSENTREIVIPENGIKSISELLVRTPSMLIP